MKTLVLSHALYRCMTKGEMYPQTRKIVQTIQGKTLFPFTVYISFESISCIKVSLTVTMYLDSDSHLMEGDT